MIDIASHIEYLLLRHDCVVVPGLGAFLVNDTPAYYDPSSGLFMPPSRSLGFNPSITHNDGLLAGSVARRECITLDAASAQIDSEVAIFRHGLAVSGELPFGHLGTLTLGPVAGTYLFEPSMDALPLMRYAAMQPIAIAPVVEEDPEPVASVSVSPHIVTIPTPLKIVASVVLLLVTFGLLYTTTGMVSGPQHNMASLDTGLRANVETVLPVDNDDSALSREIVLNIAIPSERPVSVDPGVAAIVRNTSSDVKCNPDRYILVVASFPTLRSAMRHIGADSTLKVLEMDGNYRVYAASCATINEARIEADRLRPDFPYVWVCRR